MNYFAATLGSLLLRRPPPPNVTVGEVCEACDARRPPFCAFTGFPMLALSTETLAFDPFLLCLSASY